MSANFDFLRPRSAPTEFTSQASFNAAVIKEAESIEKAYWRSMSDADAERIASQMAGSETNNGVDMIRAVLTGDEKKLLNLMRLEMAAAIKRQSELDAYEVMGV
jgi:hypothetical protein